MLLCSEGKGTHFLQCYGMGCSLNITSYCGEDKRAREEPSLLWQAPSPEFFFPWAANVLVAGVLLPGPGWDSSICYLSRKL